MGFLHAGELFITGRRSEMLIVRGRNIFPQDVEATVIGAHERIRPGGAAAFALETRSDLSGDTVEGVGLVVEVRKSDGQAPTDELVEEIGRAVERAVNEVHGVTPARVALCLPGAVVKTSSGKRKRSSTGAALVSGELADAGLLLADRRRGADAPAKPAVAAKPEAEPEYERLVAATARQFALGAGAEPARLFHPRGTTLRGRLRVLPLETPDLEAAAVFSAGAEHPVIVRHANGATDDDAGWDNRGATVRILPAGRPDDLDAPVLDLLLTTGACFTSATAADFVAWMQADRGQREELVRRNPHLGRAAWEMFRLPEAYNHVHYHSKVASRYRTVEGRELIVRYRLIDPEHPEDSGLLEPNGLLPPDRADRLPDETRSKTFLHDRLRSDVAAGGLRYVLQVQLRPRDEQALDATRAWDEPWLDRAELLLTEVVDEARIEPLAFNPTNAPEQLGVLPATRATEPASLNHLRSIVYAAAAERRIGTAAPARRRVAVIGGGVSGLTAARELERRGHDVVVLERSGEVGGKARSIEVDGLVFDLGAHLCSRGYERLGALLRGAGDRDGGRQRGDPLEPRRRVRPRPRGSRPARGVHALPAAQAGALPAGRGAGPGARRRRARPARPRLLRRPRPAGARAHHVARLHRLGLRVPRRRHRLRPPGAQVRRGRDAVHARRQAELLDAEGRLRERVAAGRRGPRRRAVRLPRRRDPPAGWQRRRRDRRRAAGGRRRRGGVSAPRTGRRARARQRAN